MAKKGTKCHRALQGDLDEAENGDARNYRSYYRRGDIGAKFLGKMCLPEVQEALAKGLEAH